MRGIKTGLGEIDFLAVRPSSEGFECWHVEVTVSFRPIAYIGGGPNARKRDAASVELGVDEYIYKKFTADKKAEKRNKVFPGANWKFVLVAAEVRHERELELFAEKGLTVYRYKDVLAELSDATSQVNSTAGSIIEILRYMQHS